MGGAGPVYLGLAVCALAVLVACGRGLGFTLSGFGVRVLGFGFRASDFGFQVVVFGFCVSCLGFRVQGVGFRVQGLGLQVYGFGQVCWVCGGDVFGVYGFAINTKHPTQPLPTPNVYLGLALSRSS